MKNSHPDLYTYVPKQTKHRYICHAHKDLYDLLIAALPEGNDKEKAIELLEEAFDYGIRMNNKLKEYAGKEWKKYVYK